MSDLLLELFSEEIPARLQQRAAGDLERLVNQGLLAEGFLPEAVKAFATPRRLTLVATGLPIKQDYKKEERKGPRVGAPQKAIDGFLRGAGLSSLEACEIRSDKKGEFYVAVIEKEGRESAEIIAEIVPGIVRTFPWQKSMNWGSHDLKWVRPLHSILCVFDNEIVDFTVGHIKSDDVTYGHRFMAPEKIQVRNFEDYAASLKRAKVIIDAEERAELIAQEAKTLCQAQGFELVDDKALLAEVSGLAEWPVVMIGRYDEKFLKLPDEVLIASMRGHQKYFSVRDPKTDRLTNKFIVVANMEGRDGGAAMLAGYERVLTARLSDGWFLYQQDLKIKLEDRVSDLEQIKFFDGLGSVGDKAQRVKDLAVKIAPIVGADKTLTARAASLAKADLVTGMVGEFPELQGVMGRYYALEQGEDAIVCDAIRDHYKPQGQGDIVPSEPVCVAVALAEKIDTLTGFWSINKKPTGSSDPFALRRAALGVIDLIISNKIRYALPGNEGGDGEEGSVLSFFHDRLKVYLRDKKHRHDHIDAVLQDSHGNLHNDLMLIIGRLHALETFLKTNDGVNLVAGYKRAANILRAEAKKGDLPSGSQVEDAHLVEAAEKNLFKAVIAAEEKSAAALKVENFERAMEALAVLRAPVDEFFEKVIVNADEAHLRTNRLALLVRFRDASEKIANFAKLEG